MQLYVACDVCGHRYVLPGEREGRNTKCKSCGVSFEACSDNEYDPDTSEFDEVDEDEDEDGSSLSPLWSIATTVGHVLAGLVTVGMLVWMTALLFRSPKDAWAENTQGARVATGQPVADPRYTPPQSVGYAPPQNIAPQVNPTPRPSSHAPQKPKSSSYRVGQLVHINFNGERKPAVIQSIGPNGDLSVRVIGTRGQTQVISPSQILDR